MHEALLFASARFRLRACLARSSRGRKAVNAILDAVLRPWVRTRARENGNAFVKDRCDLQIPTARDPS